MRTLIIYLCTLFLVTSCGNSNSNTTYNSYTDDDSYNDESYVYDGYYCAEVTYYNPNTGRESDYTLTVEVSNNELEKINFPQGWLDDDYFGYEEFDEDGYLSFTSYRGYDYAVQIIEEGDDCLDYVPQAVQCNGVTVDGDQCEHLTDNPTGYCWQHEDQE